MGSRTIIETSPVALAAVPQESGRIVESGSDRPTKDFESIASVGYCLKISVSE